VIDPRFASDFPKALSAHDIGLRDLIESAALLGPLPAMYLITVSVKELQPMSMELTPAVREALTGIVDRVRGILSQL
jgi:hydrogenase maturation protease